jgi:hypothetical protein
VHRPGACELALPHLRVPISRAVVSTFAH